METASPQTLKVAIVDDEEQLCLALQRILDKYQVQLPDLGTDVAYTAQYFTSGEQLLDEMASSGEFDLLLLDLKLPGISGLDVLTDLNDQNRKILTIITTAYATFETAVQAIKMGGFDFLAKPFTPEEFRHAVRKATEQLITSREAHRLADEKRRVRFNFISVLSHELKAPINAIEGYLKILRTNGSPEDQHMIDRSLARLDGMRKLIFDLLDLTRIESGEKHRSFSIVDVNALAKGAIDLFAAEAATRKISIELRTSEPADMLADADEIDIILNNLISNAIKYNRDGGSVAVEVVRKGDFTHITVADTGIGLTPEESAKLFNDFVRIKNDDTLKIMGSGLGLSTVRKLAQLYQGTASVKSEKGVGSIFTVTLRDGTVPASAVWTSQAAPRELEPTAVSPAAPSASANSPNAAAAAPL